MDLHEIITIGVVALAGAVGTLIASLITQWIQGNLIRKKEVLKLAGLSMNMHTSVLDELNSNLKIVKSSRGKHSAAQKAGKTLFLLEYMRPPCCKHGMCTGCVKNLPQMR